MRTLFRRTSAAITTTDHIVPVDDGEITVRVYRPAAGGSLPAHVYIHGGAFWLGSVAEYEPLCRWYADKARCVVVSVEYRLAPEHKFPTQPEDCYAALAWTAGHAEMLGIDPRRLSIGGTSAGGSLAAAVTLMARDRGGPQLIFQLLEIPATDCTMSQPSIDLFANGYLLTRAAMQEAVRFYLADPTQATEPYASPMLAPDLSRLPPALILTAEYDPLRDEGELYGERLRAAGVPAVVRRYPGHIHGSFFATRLLPSSRRCIDDASVALQMAHATA